MVLYHLINQAGFRPGDSTINQLLLITQNIYRSFDEIPSRETLAIFLDLSKAFDMVWHEGLIYKMESNGLHENILQIVKIFRQIVSNGLY